MKSALVTVAVISGIAVSAGSCPPKDATRTTTSHNGQTLNVQIDYASNDPGASMRVWVLDKNGSWSECGAGLDLHEGDSFAYHCYQVWAASGEPGYRTERDSGGNGGGGGGGGGHAD